VFYSVILFLLAGYSTTILTGGAGTGWLVCTGLCWLLVAGLKLFFNGRAWVVLARTYTGL